MIKAGWQNDVVLIEPKHKCDHPYDNKTKHGDYPIGSIWVCAGCEDRWQYDGWYVSEYGYYSSWNNLSAWERNQQAALELKAYKKKYAWWRRVFIKQIPDE